ncbi:MAG TPA: alr0857 family protein [Leptolyngbyaceae cyanobacterium]
MLKITYTDTGLLLERVALTVEAMVAQRTLLALRLGQSIAVQSTYASLPFPADLIGMPRLLRLVEKTGAIEISGCDVNWLEITLPGVWIAESSSSDEGIFVTELEPPLEKHLLTVWQQAQRRHRVEISQGVPKIF